MKLTRLLQSVAVRRIVLPAGFPAENAGPEEAAGRIEIGSVHCRSQNVAAGGLFVAVKGFSADGHDFIEDAVNHGASAVVVEKPASAPVFPRGSAQRSL